MKITKKIGNDIKKRKKQKVKCRGKTKKITAMRIEDNN